MEFLAPLTVLATAGVHLLRTAGAATTRAVVSESKAAENVGAGAVGALAGLLPQLPEAQPHPAVADDDGDGVNQGPSYHARAAAPAAFPRLAVDRTLDAAYAALHAAQWRAARQGKRNPDRWVNARRAAVEQAKFDSPTYYSGEAPSLV